MLKVIKSCNLYPSKVLFNRFRELLAEYTRVDVENLYPFVGADSALRTIFYVLAKPKDKVLYVEPTFTMIKIYINNRDLISVPVNSVEGDEWWFTPIEEIIDKAKNVNLIVLVDPNNPTGNPIVGANKSVIEVLSKYVAGYVVIDETYYEFAGYTVVPYISEHANLVVVRSLSKAFCLAGFRLGYVVGDKEVISRLSSIHTPFDIPTPSLVAGIAALENRWYMEKIVKEMKTVREILYERMKNMGFKVFRSLTNFLLVKDRRDLMSILRNRCIYIKKISDDLYRITVPPMDMLSKLLEALGDIA